MGFELTIIPWMLLLLVEGAAPETNPCAVVGTVGFLVRCMVPSRCSIQESNVFWQLREIDIGAPVFLTGPNAYGLCWGCRRSSLNAAREEALSTSDHRAFEDFPSVERIGLCCRRSVTG